VTSGRPARPFCSEISRENGEPLGATASRVDHWLLVEYRGLWSHDAVDGSGLSDQVKARLRELVQRHPRTKLLLIRRPDRRRASGFAVFVADSREQEERLARLDVEEHEELRGLDPFESAEAVGEPLFLVCTHGKHDRCCARYGRPLWDAVSEHLPAGCAWQCTHVGGDRFAGNVIVLPHGVYYGRVAREDVPDLIEQHLSGRVLLENYRGRSCWPFPVQAAERRIRAQEGLTGLGDLSLARIDRPEPGRWHALFHTRLGPREIDVVEELGELAQLTCDSPVARRPRRYVVTTR
jgi:hypothetical protein